MNIKVSYIEATDVTALQELVSKELEAIQLNVKNRIVDVKPFILGDKLVAQIAYAEVEEQVLKESGLM